MDEGAQTDIRHIMNEGYQVRSGAALRPIAFGGRFAALFLFLYVVLNIFPGLMTIEESKIYYSHMFIPVVFSFTFVQLLGRTKTVSLPIFILLVGLLVVLPILSGGIENERFVNEQVKLLLVIFGAVSLSHQLNWRAIDILSTYYPAIMLTMAIVTYVLGVGQYYGDEGRFGVPLLGSPNSTAYAFCAALVFALNAIAASQRWRLLNGFLALALAAVIVWTGSDGGILMLAFIVISYGWPSLRNLVILAIVTFLLSLMVLLYLPQLEIPELIGSGRLFIWNELLWDLSTRSFLIKMIGVGPGGVELHPYFTAVVLSAHSTYIEILYSYGIVGIVCLLGMIAYSLKFFGRGQFPKRQQRLLNALLIMNIVGGLVDTYIFTAQLVWLSGILFGILLFAWRTSTNEHSRAIGGHLARA